MSDFRAIGGTSATLQTLLADRMELPDGINAPVTVGPPAFSSQDADPRLEDPRVNLFLYRVTENGFLQNQQIPGHELSGYGHPPLSVNLHYLVTAYGNTKVPDKNDTLYDDTIAHFLLGSAMRVLHDVPIVTEKLTTVRAPSGRAILDTSLHGQFEQVKLTLEPLSLEDVTKVWTALALRFRLSAAYVVTVVQIESQRKRTFPRPVGKPVSPTEPPLPGSPPAPGPAVYVPTMQTPTITDLHVVLGPGGVEQSYPYARVGDTVALIGTSLAGPVTRVAIGDVIVAASAATPTRVEAVVPDAALPEGPIPAEQQLQPGALAVSVVVSDPLVPGSRFSSNETPLMLVPRVDAVNAMAGPPRSLLVDGSRLVVGAAGGETAIGRSLVPRSAYRNATPAHIEVPLPDTLPTRGVGVLIGGALGGAVVFPVGVQELQLDIGGVAKTVEAHLQGSLTPGEIAAVLEAAIHDAAPDDAGFAGARVAVLGTSIAIVPGGLTGPVSLTAATPFAHQLLLDAPQPAGAANAFVSGTLDSPPLLSAKTPRVSVTIGAQTAAVAIDPATSLEALAGALRLAIGAADPSPAFTGTLVGVTGAQLLIVPGAAQDVSFDATAADTTTVAELQLHAHFPVRVRANGAESIDGVTVELPL